MSRNKLTPGTIIISLWKFHFGEFCEAVGNTLKSLVDKELSLKTWPQFDYCNNRQGPRENE